MSTYEDGKTEFLFSVFAELNEHIRATDEKNVLIAGSFVALIAVVIAVLIDKISIISWTYFVFSLFVLLIGSCVFMLQLWYREWKEHYLEICYNIASNFKLEEKFLPFWLREHRVKRKLSADKILLLITFIIDLIIISYSIHLLWNLIKYSFNVKVIIIICSLILYFLILIIAKQKLISRQKFLIA